MSLKVVITDHLHPYLAEKLIAAGFDVDVFADISNEELIAMIQNYDGLILSTKIQVTRLLLDKAQKLKFIARAGSGMENIDVQYARSKNIHIVNSPEGNANAVGEHALGMLLALMNHITVADKEIKSGTWKREPNRGYELDGRTVGIIGYGNNGTAFAKKLRGFDITILAYDKYRSGFGNGMVRETSLEHIQQESDVISFHVPHTAETHHYFNEAFIRNCGKKIWLINTSRGKIVNTQHLIEAIESGKVTGAALDVLENENFYDLSGIDQENMLRLSKLRNVVLTPHVAGWTHESYLKISKILADKIMALNL